MQSSAFLYVAILFEVAGTMALKQSHGMSNLGPTLLTFVLYSASFSCLSIALKHVDVGIAYAIWSGLGTTLVALIGILYYKEPVSALKVLSLLMVVGGVVGLNLSGGQQH